MTAIMSYVLVFARSEVGQNSTPPTRSVFLCSFFALAPFNAPGSTTTAPSTQVRITDVKSIETVHALAFQHLILRMPVEVEALVVRR